MDLGNNNVLGTKLGIYIFMNSIFTGWLNLYINESIMFFLHYENIIYSGKEYYNLNSQETKPVKITNLVVKVRILTM